MNEQQSSSAGDSQTAEEKKSPAFHMFLYLVSFLSLGFVVAGILNVYFQLINKVIKETIKLDDYSGLFNSGSLKFGVSSLVVAIPVYYLVLYFINKKLYRGEIDLQSIVRKFATYFASFVFSAMGVGSLVAIIYNYLDGELTTKFFLKALTFLVASFFFFGFYFWEIRRKEILTKPFRIFFGASLALALSALVIGFVIVDSPSVAREKKQDREMVNEMMSIQSNINLFYSDNQRLPKADGKEMDVKKGIEYLPTEEANFQLCANFLQANDPELGMLEWNHPSGRYCFDLNALRDEPKNIEAPLMTN